MSSLRPVANADEWNELASRMEGANLLQSASWGDLKARYGWRVTRLAMGDMHAPRGGVQVLTRTRRVPPLGPSVGLAYVPRGPLAESDADAESLIEGAVGEARRRGSFAAAD